MGSRREMRRSKLFFALSSALASSALIGSGLPSSLDIFSTKVARAEDGIGRLPDGTAYRTSSDGYRIVDQIAELEVENEDLRRQVLALENALDAQQQEAPSGKFVEKTTTRVEPRAYQARCETPKREEFCQPLVDPLYSRISKLQSELMRGSGEQAADAGKKDREIAQLQAHIAELQTALMQGPSQEVLEQETSKRRGLERSMEELRQQTVQDKKTILALQSKVSSLSRMESDLQQTQRSLDETIAALENKLVDEAKLQTQLAEVQDELASLKQVAIAGARKRQTVKRSRAKLASKEVERTSEQITNTTTEVSHARVYMTRKLKSINSLINERKRRKDALRRKKKGATIALSSLKTSRGVSLDHLRREVSELSSSSPLSSIRKGLSEIEQILQDDIQVLKRLERM